MSTDPRLARFYSRVQAFDGDSRILLALVAILLAAAVLSSQWHPAPAKEILGPAVISDILLITIAAIGFRPYLPALYAIIGLVLNFGFLAHIVWVGFAEPAFLEPWMGLLMNLKLAAGLIILVRIACAEAGRWIVLRTPIEGSATT